MLVFSIKKIIKYLFVITIALTVLSLMWSLFRYYYPGHMILENLNNLFNTDKEANIPTYFSAFLILFNSVILFIIAKNVKNKFTKCWYFLAAIFLFLSVDEFAQIHEKIDMEIFINNFCNNFFGFGWKLLYLMIILILILIYKKLFASLPKFYRKYMIIAVIIYTFGAIGLEIIAGYFTYDKFVYKCFNTTEEFFEMTGMIIFCWAILNYLNKIKPDLKIGLSK